MPVFVGGALGGAELMHDDEAFADGVLARRRSVRFGETTGEGETTASPLRRVRWVHWIGAEAFARASRMRRVCVRRRVVVFVLSCTDCERDCDCAGIARAMARRRVRTRCGPRCAWWCC
jgi:hypothetical protein